MRWFTSWVGRVGPCKLSLSFLLSSRLLKLITFYHFRIMSHWYIVRMRYRAQGGHKERYPAGVVGWYACRETECSLQANTRNLALYHSFFANDSISGTISLGAYSLSVASKSSSREKATIFKIAGFFLLWVKTVFQKKSLKYCLGRASQKISWNIYHRQFAKYTWGNRWRNWQRKKCS